MKEEVEIKLTEYLLACSFTWHSSNCSKINWIWINKLNMVMQLCFFWAGGFVKYFGNDWNMRGSHWFNSLWFQFLIYSSSLSALMTVRGRWLSGLLGKNALHKCKVTSSKRCFCWAKPAINYFWHIISFWGIRKAERFLAKLFHLFVVYVQYDNPEHSM